MFGPMKPLKVEFDALFWKSLEKASVTQHTLTFRKVIDLELLYAYGDKLSKPSRCIRGTGRLRESAWR